MKLSELGEDRLLRSLLADLPRGRQTVVTAGDDCAAVRLPGAQELLLLKTDCIVEGIHFRRGEKPEAVGWKALARALSDIAAMGGRPGHGLITLVVAGATKAGWVRGLYRGLGKAARQFGVGLVGGETSAIKGPAVISISLTGTVPEKRMATRRGGRNGDVLYVTGRLGGSGKGRHLRFVPRLEEGRWLTERFSIHAMIDLSDGLGADLPRLAQASGVGFRLERAAVPRNRGCTVEEALSDGEDYELLFALPPKESSALERRWKGRFPRLPLTRIGTLTRDKNSGAKLHGYVHFK